MANSLFRSTLAHQLDAADFYLNRVLHRSEIAMPEPRTDRALLETVRIGSKFCAAPDAAKLPMTPAARA